MRHLISFIVFTIIFLACATTSLAGIGDFLKAVDDAMEKATETIDKGIKAEPAEGLTIKKRTNRYDELLKEIETFVKNSSPDQAYRVKFDNTIEFEEKCTSAGTSTDFFNTETSWNIITGTDNNNRGAEVKIRHNIFNTKEQACLIVKFTLVKDKQFFGKLKVLISEISKSIDTENVSGNIVNIAIGGSRYNVTMNIMELLESHYFVIRHKLQDAEGNVIQEFDSEIGTFYLEGTTIDSLTSNGFNVFKSTFYDHIPLEVSPDSVSAIEISVATLEFEREEQKAREEQNRAVKAMEEQEQQEAVIKAEAERQKREDQKAREEQEQQEAVIKAEAKRQELVKHLLPKCNGTIMSQIEFYQNNNPYADKGKCVKLNVKAFEMVDANKGLFWLTGTDLLVAVEFEKVFRGRVLLGIARLEGMYEYTTNLGSSNSVPHFKIIEQVGQDNMDIWLSSDYWFR